MKGNIYTCVNKNDWFLHNGLFISGHPRNEIRFISPAVKSNVNKISFMVDWNFVLGLMWTPPKCLVLYLHDYMLRDFITAIKIHHALIIFLLQLVYNNYRLNYVLHKRNAHDTCSSVLYTHASWTVITGAFRQVLMLCFTNCQ